MTFSPKGLRAARSGLFVVGVLIVAGCSAPSTANSGSETATHEGQASDRPTIPTSPNSGTQEPMPSQARDGSTLIPTPEILTCSALAPDRVREILGGLADEIQPAQTAGTIDPAGVKREDCIYSLDPSGTTTHALILEVSTYPDKAKLEADKPFESLTGATEVSDLKGEARFSVNTLSQSRESVLTMVDEATVRRLVLALPNTDRSLEGTEGLSTLKELAKAAGF